jgi:hypothetical protein
MKAPNFFIIGAPKCGTTALSEYLRNHPNIFMSWPKEPHYFAHDFPMYKAQLPSLESYLNLFKDADESNHFAIGEASVYYLYSREAIEAIRQFNPAARLIVMLRNPIDIVPSMHSQLQWTLDEDIKDLEVAWRHQPKRAQGENLPRRCREPALLQYGELASVGAQVQRLLEIFPREQIRFILFDDFKASTHRVYDSVLEFLDIAKDNRRDFPVVNGNKEHKYKVISRFTQRPPKQIVLMANSVKKVLGVKRLGIMNKVRSISTETRRREPLTSELKAELADYFKNDIDTLSMLLDRNLTHWYLF